MTSSPRKYNKRIFSAAACLLLCVVLSCSMLFGRMTAFLAQDTTHYIPLTRSAGTTAVTRTGSAAAPLPAPGRPVLLTAPMLSASWFRVYDENTVWSGQTQVEIFRVSYDGTGGQITVQSRGEDKVIAPGTANTYEFALKNTAAGPVKYQMSMEAYLQGTDLLIPVQATVRTGMGEYLCGSETQPQPVLALNQVQDSGVLSRGYVMPYTLQWEWPFEGDDALDTTLGNLAVDQDLTLTIVINTVASYIPEGEGGIPQTGDTSHILLYTCLMLASLAGLLLLLLFRPRQEETHEQG